MAQDAAPIEGNEEGPRESTAGVQGDDQKQETSEEEETGHGEA